MIPLILLLQADSDIQNAFNRYEEFGEGRGSIFLKQIDSALGILRANPGIGRKYAGSYRRLVIRKTPFGIFYQAQPTRLIVAAVLDLRQDPVVIRRTLGFPP